MPTTLLAWTPAAKAYAVVAMVFWHGDAAEQVAMLQAVAHNCTCSSDDGIVNGSCPAHRALLDQRFLDGCLFMRSLAERLLVEEFDA